MYFKKYLPNLSRFWKAWRVLCTNRLSTQRKTYRNCRIVTKIDLLKNIRHNQIKFSYRIWYWSRMVDFGPSNPCWHVNNCYFLIFSCFCVDWCVIFRWLTKGFWREIIVEINRRCHYVLNFCVYCCLFVTVQKKNQTHGTFLKLVNLICKIITQIHHLDSYFHRQQHRTHSFDLFPTPCFYKSKRSQTIRKWHLSQTWSNFLMVTSQYYWVHLGTSILKGFMYFFYLIKVNFIISGSATQWYLQQT